jgi:hypothetical protein
MKSRLLHNRDGQRTFVVVLQTGDEAIACLQSFAVRERLGAAQISAIGAFSDAVLGYFDWQKKEYLRNPADEQLEVASLLGDVAQAADQKPALHIHAVLGRRDGSALAGHLLSAHVRPTLEVILTEQPAHLKKVHDAESGLALIAPEKTPGSG